MVNTTAIIIKFPHLTIFGVSKRNCFTGDTLMIITKLCYHGNLLFPTNLSPIFWWFSPQKKETRPRHLLNIFLCLPDHAAKESLANGRAKLARKAFNIRMSGTQYVAMVTELLSWYCGTNTTVECYYKESNISDTNQLGHLFLHIWSKF